MQLEHSRLKSVNCLADLKVKQKNGLKGGLILLWAKSMKLGSCHFFVPAFKVVHRLRVVIVGSMPTDIR